MRKVLLGAVSATALVFAASAAYAGNGNTGTNTIVGNDNTADILQVGNNNSASNGIFGGFGVGGTADNNTADIVQVGDGNLADGTNKSVTFKRLQDAGGTNPPAEINGPTVNFSGSHGIRQEGDWNQAGIFQRGDDNMATIEQTQDLGDATAAYNGDVPGLFGNEALVVQNGDRNEAGIDQNGYSNLSRMVVTGSDNDTYNRQQFDRARSFMTVTGDRNVALAWQNTSSGLQPSAGTVSGNDNFMTINGEDNKAYTFQDGSDNTATHSITGDNNVSHVTQL